MTCLGFPKVAIFGVTSMDQLPSAEQLRSQANTKYPIELRERAVRLYRESDRKVIAQLARQLDVRPRTLRNWIRQDEADLGKRDDRSPTGSNLPERREEIRNPGLLGRSNLVRWTKASLVSAARPYPTTTANGMGARQIITLFAPVELRARTSHVFLKDSGSVIADP